jgi:hypothetical protein
MTLYELKMTISTTIFNNLCQKIFDHTSKILLVVTNSGHFSFTQILVKSMFLRIFYFFKVVNKWSDIELT